MFHGILILQNTSTPYQKSNEKINQNITPKINQKQKNVHKTIQNTQKNEPKTYSQCTKINQKNTKKIKN